MARSRPAAGARPSIYITIYHNYHMYLGVFNGARDASQDLPTMEIQEPGFQASCWLWSLRLLLRSTQTLLKQALMCGAKLDQRMSSAFSSLQCLYILSKLYDQIMINYA